MPHFRPEHYPLNPVRLEPSVYMANGPMYVIYCPCQCELQPCMQPILINSHYIRSLQASQYAGVIHIPAPVADHEIPHVLDQHVLPRNLEDHPFWQSDEEDQHDEDEDEDVLPPDVEDEHDLLPNDEDEHFLPPNAEDQHVLPPHVEDQYFLPPNVEDQHFLPPNVEDQHVFPPHVEDQYFLPPNVQDQQFLPPNVEDQHFLPPNVEDQHFLPLNAQNQRFENEFAPAFIMDQEPNRLEYPMYPEVQPREYRGLNRVRRSRKSEENSYSQCDSDSEVDR